MTKKKSFSCLNIVGIFFIMFFGYFLWSLTIGFTNRRPAPKPPAEASDVHFYEWGGWQSWTYQYRFDAPREVCEKFAISLMKNQSFQGKDVVIEVSEFEAFPIGSTRFQPWFDVHTVKRGALITADDWIYAAIDYDRNRLYYYNSH